MLPLSLTRSHSWPNIGPLEPLLLVVCLWIHGNYLTHQRPGNVGIFGQAWPKVNGAWGVPLWVHPPNFSSLWLVVWLQMHGNCSTNQKPGNDRNSGNHDQKSIGPGESYNWFTHQIWAQSNQQFVSKYSETVQQTRGEERAGIQQIVNKS